MREVSSPSPSLASALDGLEDGAQAVQQLQKAGNDGPVGGQFPIAQQAKQILASVSKFLEPLEAKKSGGSLDGVHGAEDIAEQGGVLRPLLQDRSDTAPCGPALPGSRSGTPSSVHPLRPLIHGQQGCEAPGAASTQDFYRMKSGWT